MSRQQLGSIGCVNRASHLHTEEVSKADLSNVVANVLIVEERTASDVGVAGLHGNVRLD